MRFYNNCFVTIGLIKNYVENILFHQLELFWDFGEYLGAFFASGSSAFN